MTTIYYLFTIIFIWYELQWIYDPLRETKENELFSKLHDEFKGKKWDDFPEEYKSLLKAKLLSCVVIAWLFIGLFTFQWIAFLAILAFNILIIAPISKLTKFSRAYTILHWLNSVVGFMFGLFVIINHYHLKLDLTQLLIDFIDK